MSVRAMTWAWEQDTETHSDKLVLLALADHADNDGVCWPGLRHVEGKTGVSVRTVRRAIRRLADAGLMTVETRTREDGSSTSSRYLLTVNDSVTPHPGHGDTPPGHSVRPPRTQRPPPPEPTIEGTTTTTPPSPPRGGERHDDDEPTPERRRRDDPWPAKPTKANGSHDYPELFEAAWESYPDRDGPNPKMAAYKSFRARVTDGERPADLFAATLHYRQHLQAKDKEGTPYVQQASTFWGPGEPFREFIESPSVNGSGQKKKKDIAFDLTDPEDRAAYEHMYGRPPG